MNSKKNIAIVLGETGVGKSSFINAITQKYTCKVSSEPKACTIDYDIINCSHKGKEFFFVDKHKKSGRKVCVPATGFVWIHN